MNQIPLNRPTLSSFGKVRLQSVIDSGWWTLGKQVEELEKEFALYIGADHAIAVSSCSAGLHMAMMALDSKNRIMYTTPLTFCSTINAHLHAGGTRIHFIDVGEDQNINVDLLEEDIKSMGGWGVIVPVHFAGKACDMDRIVKIAKDTHSYIVEDCAHAVETTYKGYHMGTHGHIGVFSFNPTKNVCAPEMGMVVTNSEAAAKYIRRMRLHSMSSDVFERIKKPGNYDITDLGFKYNPTDIEAMFALDSLFKIGSNWLKRKTMYNRYTEVFEELEKTGKFNGFRTHVFESSRNIHALHLYNIYIGNRDDFILKMNFNNICCGIHYKPVHLHSYYKDRFSPAYLEKAEFIGKHTVSLPMGPAFTTDEVDHIMKTVKELLNGGVYLI